MKLKGPLGPRGPLHAPAEIAAATDRLSVEDTDNSIAINGLTYGAVIYQSHPDYDSLPEGIKIAFSPRDYSVMPDEEKKSLLFDIMNPEVEED